MHIVLDQINKAYFGPICLWKLVEYLRHWSTLLVCVCVCVCVGPESKHFGIFRPYGLFELLCYVITQISCRQYIIQGVWLHSNKTLPGKVKDLVHGFVNSSELRNLLITLYTWKTELRKMDFFFKSYIA